MVEREIRFLVLPLLKRARVSQLRGLSAKPTHFITSTTCLHYKLYSSCKKLFNFTTLLLLSCFYILL